MKLWGGRFTQGLDPQAFALNASIDFDRRLALQDVRGSQAWARALGKTGVISQKTMNQIISGLQSIKGEFEAGQFEFKPGDEDIHTAVERRLGELIGPAAGELHTGRSRNDQVATDLRLWLLDSLPGLDGALVQLERALIDRAETDLGVIMPGYTHLQHAQPVLLSHWWLSHFWPLQRDRQRLSQLAERTAVLPLGCGALAGVPFPIERNDLAQELGFQRPAANSIDAVSDRDFVAEFLFWAAMTAVHLSKLAEALILFLSAEFGFIELSDAYATGSSLMPQKKNPDIFELARGKSGSLIGLLTGMLATLKGLPSAYDKDLQEDKVPVFQAHDTLTGLLPVLAKAVRSLEVHPERMRAQIDAAMMATDLADYLVVKGLPFRQAHALAGQVVQLALQQDKPLDELSLEALQSLNPAFEADVYAVFDPERSLARRATFGGTAPQAVKQQLRLAQQALQQAHKEVDETNL
jgi:argininosuccinate lyase